MTAQWGSTPFSQVPKRVESIQKWSSSGGLRICERDGRPAAAMVLGDAQPTKTETFTVGEWPGQVLERRIGVPAAQ